MHLMLPHKLQIITIVVSVFVYSCNASDGSVVSRLVDHTQSTVHSNRPPEPSTPSTTKNSHHSSSSQQQQQQQQPKDKLEKSKSSYAMLSQAMSEAVHHEFNSLSGSGASPVTEREGSACLLDDADCLNHDKLGMEAIRHLHQQLDDDEDGDITLAESDDFLREELKYESGYEKRHKAFHHNDDLHISVKELWEAWLRSEVHNWTVDQTTEWLAQSVQLPQYVRIFRQHKVTGRVLPLLAVNNMHYVSTVLGIKDPIHKQKIALKAMDAVLFGPPRETGTRWKDLLLVALLLTAIIGSWYAYQQNKNAKFHMRRMAKDMEGLHSAEVALQEMQKELERARVEQENVGKEKLDLERRLKEAPSLKSSDSDLEVQALKQEIEILRNELSRAEGELVDQCYSPPPGLQIWLQLTYELESRAHLKKRIAAEKQLQTAREACEKLRRKRSSLYGAFVSTHGKSIDDVDRSIVEARNALSEVTSELQERTHRWKQIEQMLGFSIMSNNGISYLENVLYNKNGKSMSRARITSSQDDLDDDSVQASPMAAKWPDHKVPTWSPWSPNHRPPSLQLPQTTTAAAAASPSLVSSRPPLQQFNRLVFPSTLSLDQVLPPPEQEQRELLEDLDRLEQEREALMTSFRRSAATTTTSSNWKTPPQLTRQASAGTFQSLRQTELRHKQRAESMEPRMPTPRDDENFTFPSAKSQIRQRLHESIKRSIDSCSIKSDPF
ncbi:stromal interaction molecule homolog isoform X2 [Culicoides brevitarsis]|uniref:stromal interaction molecule homolog isoform X2 n=1 Tax=Culicoides brevitarsis TaxID=469753 RepID=UPI00307BCE05